ncbi:MAG TPA: hypothetical protein VKB84_08585, partial [Candidatus Binataceae bacterium]|nr:hypothetical protein [Candidatus Binataceae bacterium]
MFRRRPAKRGRAGFARNDITALGDGFADMLTSPVRDAPPIARQVPISERDLPRPAQQANVPQAERPRPRPQSSKPARPDPARSRPAKSRGSAPRLLRRAGYLAVHSVEKSFGRRQVVRGVSIY